MGDKRELPEWAQKGGGPTVHATLLNEAKRHSMARPDVIEDYVPKRFFETVAHEVDACLSRAYIMGVADGYQQAAQAFDAQKGETEIPEGCVLVDRAEYEQMKQDIRDMNASPQAAFMRCACGRIRSQGLICPTNAEGGTCEAGR